MTNSDRTDYRRGETQADHLTSEISDDRALVRLPSRHMHRYPSRSAHKLDLDFLRDLAPLDLTANLFGFRPGTPKVGHTLQILTEHFAKVVAPVLSFR